VDPEEHPLDAADLTTAPARRRRSRIGWAIGAAMALVVAVVLAGLAVAWQADANRNYDEARSGFTSAAERVQSERDALADAVAEQQEALTIAGTIADTATADVVDPTTLETFEGAVAASRAATAEADEALAAPRSDVDDADDARADGADAAEADARPFWPWELAEAENELTRDDREARDTVASLRDLRERFDATVSAVDAATPAFLASTRASADRLEAENPSARSADLVAFRSAADAVATREDLTLDASDALAAFVAATSQLRSSNQAELDEKAGPLLDQRLAAEGFARSLAGDVLIDFDWAPIVNGYGSGGTVGGLAAWIPDSGGYATITLSDSVAAFWPSELSQALVAHEVGHAVSVRCGDRFDASTRAANEAWATAWAISRGFTGDGNGVSIYGSPPQGLIDAAATCG
jgi:hypothetical protein